jgi:hypothetical protein
MMAMLISTGTADRQSPAISGNTYTVMIQDNAADTIDDGNAIE